MNEAPAKIAKALLRTLSKTEHLDVQELEQRRVAQEALKLLHTQQRVALQLHFGEGLDAKRMASELGGDLIAVQRAIKTGLQDFIFLLRQHGWIKWSGNQWVFDSQFVANGRNLPKPDCISMMPPPPKTAAEACELFGVSISDPPPVKLQAVAKVAQLVSQALQLMQE